ncbi:fatty acid--CoA ligase [Peribacillus deserti]|uniref:Long-chain fatty acid--CoA ligase n=1 Tax=Peribacillus deserti TaxID=673318 RepID=A0A2N5MAI4_9BACI|nr:fatty acid--CoA ligase [Peribacillus deserti]PLT31382.1 long-chain fatty acid--CoA ligase [Peribacillus deserti]
MGVTIGHIFDLTVKKYPHREALYDVRKNKRLTYKEWQDEVDALANAFLAAGVKKGDLISTYLFNTGELATAYFACAKIGAVFNPINFRLTSEETAFILEDAQPKIVLFEEATQPVIASIENRFPHISFWFIDERTPAFAQNYYDKKALAPSAPVSIEVNETDLYAIMYTSGTTGRPKGVMHSHRDMAEQSLLCITATGITSKDRGLITAPMFHCAELHCAFLPRVHAGASSVVLHQFNPRKVLQLIESEKISILFAAPTMWNMMLQENLSEYDVSSLRLGLYGAAPMAPALVRTCREKLGADLVQAYGMTEMGPAITFLSNDDQIRKAGSAGQAALNHDIRIVKPNEEGPSEPDDILPPYEPGEIIVQGPCMMKGYYKREEAAQKALYKGWYHSGDIGYLDEDGFLYVKDRVDDMIISGGENIYPREVEDTLYEHEGVLDAAVIGEPHDRWGESVTAIVVKKNDALTEEELDEFCKSSSRLANFKRPRRYVFVDVLPRNASGKVLKFQLRKELETIYSDRY